MPSVNYLENKISNLEGFDVRFTIAGRDVRGDRSIQAGYGYINRARGDWTVAEWKRNRFMSSFAGFEVEVYDGFGNLVSGQVKLENLRATY
jgi:hypothetical protein